MPALWKAASNRQRTHDRRAVGSVATIMCAIVLMGCTAAPVDLECTDNSASGGGSRSSYWTAISGVTIAEAAADCSCVSYVKNKFGLTESIGNAKDIGPRLRDLGFRQASNPQVGAVVIFQPSFGPGINQDFGHTGVISEVSERRGEWSIVVTGAAQGGESREDAGCSNVSDVRYRSYPQDSSSVSYWVQ